MTMDAGSQTYNYVNSKVRQDRDRAVSFQNLRKLKRKTKQKKKKKKKNRQKENSA